MDYSVLNRTVKAEGKGKLPQLPDLLEQNKNGLAGLVKGQHITGMVVSVGDKVTIDFDGQKVNANRDTLKNVVPGEYKTFEVVKASSHEIELRLLEETTAQVGRIIKANMIPDTDWEAILEKKREEEKQAKKEEEIQETREKLEKICNRITDEDCEALEREGYSVENMSVHEINAALDRMKANYTDPLEAALSGSGSASSRHSQQVPPTDQREIANRLQEAKLPVTAQNLEQLSKALILSDAITKIDDKTMKYLIQNSAQPTAENIYKAYYSAGAGYQEPPLNLTQEEWSALEGQIHSVIEDAGYDVNEDNLKEARWLLENKLPLTAETFSYKKSMGELKDHFDRNQVLKRMVDGMKEGKHPKDVSVTDENSQAHKRLLDKLQSISREAVDYAVLHGKELTIKGLSSIQGEIAVGSITLSEGIGVPSNTANTIEEAATQGLQTDITADADAQAPIDRTSASYEQLKAHRQLEEIRLKMTLEAAQRLEKKGIAVETQKLEKLVEELRKLEDCYYQNFLREADMQEDAEALQTLKTTTQSIEQLKYTPSYILGSTLSLRETQTIPGLLTEGARLQAELAKAGTAYETLMTVPNQEYGDSIRKAFAHIDPLLSELGIDISPENQRAARILGYNSMEITQENLDRVKAYDQQVTSLINNLHPAVAVRMIRNGINPLNTPIQELNKQIDQMKEEQGITAEEKFSSYLRKLEQQNGITAEERKTYIGIYRLLYQVEKSDGAVLGSVIKADREVTLSSLLTAVQTAGKGRLDAIINDEFGLLTGMKRSKESIAEQLSSFSGSSSASEYMEEQSQKEHRLEEQTEYLNRILKQISDEISPEKLTLLQQKLVQQTALSSASEQAKAGGDNQNAGSELWEKISQLPAEKLLRELQDMQENPEIDQEYYARKAEQLRELSKNSEQAIRFLKDYQISSTPQSIQLANHILSNGESPIVRLLKRQSENSNDFTEKNLKENGELSDKLIDKTSMNETYSAMEDNAKALVEQTCAQETLDSRKLAELRSISQQITFLRRLAEKEFYQIPIETSKGYTTMNLTILRGSEHAGKVTATIHSELLGELKADFSLKDGALKGFISSDNQAGLDRVKENTAQIVRAAEENNIIIKQLDFGIQQKDGNYRYPHPADATSSKMVGNDTERILYRIAKALVQTVRLSEETDTNAQKAVS